MMYNFLLVLLIVIVQTSILRAQNDCESNPSCQHTKTMLLEAGRQWGNLDQGINTNSRSDTIDILNYSISLDMTNLADRQMDGYCAIRFAAKANAVTNLKLDLLQLKVDSIVQEGAKLSYNYNDTLINVTLLDTLNTGDTSEVIVYYNGSPQQDRDWGGFYYKDGYAFNLGVGFASNPHNYGRIWHPCFDNFIERAIYTFHIKTTSDKKAHCNGYLQSENILDGINTRTWKMKAPIPTYLACIAIGDYAVVRQSHEGVAGTVPIELVATAEDTAKVKKSFQNLKKAIAAYEYWYGPHRWSKVGYSFVPFRSGAMEHATNITYPMSAANGTLYREHLMVHELGHSWWGNLVTCETAVDMWINEGMASYSEYLFWEYTYGWKRYIDKVKENHYKVLRKAHQQEKGYRPLTGVPHEYTYGMHVYDKGAAVAHNMRWYLGDSLFRKGLHYVMDAYQYKNLNSASFRDALTYSTGVDMTQFFDDWVFLGGFPHFEIVRSIAEKENESYKVKVYIKQSLLGRDIYCREVPLELTFMDNNWNKFKTTIRVSDRMDSATVIVPFLPTVTILNEGHLLNQARFDYQFKIMATDTVPIIISMREVGFHSFKAQNVTDSVWLHLEHHLVEPSNNGLPNGCTLSSKHYWSVNGVVSDGFEAQASLQNDLIDDEDLMAANGLDSLILLYRGNCDESWQIHPNYTKRQTNKVTFTFSLLKGDYAFANGQVQPEIFKPK